MKEYSDLSEVTLQTAVEYFSNPPPLNLQPNTVLVLRRHIEELDGHYGEGKYCTAQAEYHAYFGGWLEDDNSQEVLHAVFKDWI